MSDDLYFIGAALNMAHGGTFCNPTCSSQAMWGAGDNFFVYPPFHSFALLAWLKLVGISRHAFVIFQAIAGAVASLCLIDLIRPSGSVLRVRLIAAGVTLTVVILASGLGLRPDLFALALFAAGSRLVYARSLRAYFGNSLLLFLSTITNPSFLFLVFILIALVFWFQRNQDRSVLLKRILVTALAGLGVFFIFLCMIGFELHTFLTVFNQFRHHSTFQAPYPIYSASVWRTAASIICIYAPAILSVATPLVVFLFSSTFNRPGGRIIMAGALASGIALIFASYQSGSGIVYLNLFDLVVLLYLLGRLLTARATAILGTLLGVAFLGTLLLRGRHLLLFLLQPALPVHNHIPDYLAQIARTQPTEIYVDSAAASSLYDYRLPPNAHDAFYGYKGLWAHSPLAENLPVGTVFVVASWLTDQLGFLAGAPASSTPRPATLKTPTHPYQLIYVRVSQDPSSRHVFEFVDF